MFVNYRRDAHQYLFEIQQRQTRTVHVYTLYIYICVCVFVDMEHKPVQINRAADSIDVVLKLTPILNS